MTETAPAALSAIETRLLSMPPARALQLRIAGCAQGRMRLEAPLAANVNDKGSAFGGSLASLMTLAAWGLTALQVEQAGLRADVYVADAEVRYLLPLHADLCAEAWLADAGAWSRFLATLRARGRARATLDAHVLAPDGRAAATSRARYAAIMAPAY